MPHITKASIRTFIASTFLGFAFGLFGLFGLFREAVRYTPLFRNVQRQFIDACRSGSIQEMEQLYLKGASPTVWGEDLSGGSYGPPILAAAENAHPEAVKWLLEHGATWDVGISDGWTPLGAAEVKKREAEKTQEILRAYGAKPLSSK